LRSSPVLRRKRERNDGLRHAAQKQASDPGVTVKIMLKKRPMDRLHRGTVSIAKKSANGLLPPIAFAIVEVFLTT
jgi:hypothetical protein